MHLTSTKYALNFAFQNLKCKLFPSKILSGSPIPTKTTFIAMEKVTDLENYITSCSSMFNEAYTTTITTSLSNNPSTTTINITTSIFNNPTVSNRENGINNTFFALMFITLSAETNVGTSNNKYIIASVVIATSLAILLVAISFIMLTVILHKCYLKKDPIKMGNIIKFKFL